MDESWVKKYNSIPKQIKGPTDRIAANEWNFIVNVLSEQANNNTIGGDKLFKALKRLQEKELDDKEFEKILLMLKAEIKKVEFDSLIMRYNYQSEFPETGVTGKLYYESIEGNVFFWSSSGSAYRLISYEEIYNFEKRITTLENESIKIGGDHSLLSLFSRNKPNQHTIDAITGLKPKVEVFISNDEPTTRVDTWFDTKEIVEGDNSGTNWRKIKSTPTIFEGAVIVTLSLYTGEFIKLVVVGSMAGKQYIQELHGNELGQIKGEVIVSVSEDYEEIASVLVSVNKIDGENAFVVEEFINTGNVLIQNFTALSIEVYRR